MPINFISLNPAEHDNGVAIGSLSYSGAEQGSFDIYWDNQKQLYQITDDVLYLTESWHFDSETSEYRSYTVNSDSISWSSWGIGDLTVKFTPTDGGNDWGVIAASEFVFSDINETITLNSLSSDAFEYGAQVASVAIDNVDFQTVGTIASYLRIVDGALALESGSYYNPNSDRIIRPDATYYDLSGGETTAGIVLYDENDKVAVYESVTLTDTLFSNVSPANTPYYAGSSTATASQSSDLYIKSLLYENPVVWRTDAVNEQYQTDAEETVITYSFSGINGSTGDYTADYSLPNPNSDTIFPFADHHMEATRLALAEFENVANLKFVEIQETEDQVGTLRFAFTDAENLLDNGTQAGGWASAPWPNATGGDVWMHTAVAPDDTTWDRGSSYKFSTLLHEIGHALGLNHPFEDPYIIPSGFDFTNYTLMSYTDPENAWWYPYWADSGSYTISSTPMVYDIAALQHLYGVASHNETDTEYAYDVETPFSEAIWDTGGNDTLNFGEFSTDLKISLKAGSYSTIPFSIANPNDEYVTLDWSMENNLGISFGALIENATGGSGNDIILGNLADNTLMAGAGDDLILFSGGTDVVDGGAGTDTLLIGSRSVSGYYSEIGEATPSFAIKPISDGSNEHYVYLKVGNHQTITQNIESFEINGVSYDTDPLSNQYLGKNFETYDPEAAISNETTDVTQTFVLTAASGKYLVDGSVAPTLTLLPGNTYAFDLSDASLVTHPLKFKLDGVEWSSGITTTGTLGVDQITYVTLPSDFEGSFEYYCANHAGMGNDIQLYESTTLVPITLGKDALTGLELSFVSSTAEDAVVTVLDGQLDYSTITTFTHVTLEEGSYTADIAISDVISSLKHIVGLETLTGAGLIAADVDNDGDVAIADVISQLKHIVGLETLNTFDAVDTGGNQLTEITAQTSDIQLVLNGDVDLSTALNSEYAYQV